MTRNRVPAPFFPAPLPDELLFSIISRYHLLSVNRSSRETLTQLVCTPHPVTFTGLPSRIGTLLSRTPSGWADSAAAVIDGFTLFPYFRPFLPASQAGNALNLIVGPSAGVIKTGLGLAASRVGAADIPRYCPLCAEEDVSAWGVSYWHRAHLLPGGLVCHRHGVELVEVRFPPEHPYRHLLFLPLSTTTEGHRKFIPLLTDHQRRLLAAISRNSQELLHLNLPSLSRSWVRGRYLERLETMGMTTGSGTVRQGELYRFLKAHYSAITCLPTFKRLFSAEHYEYGWIASMLHTPRKSTHPLKHLLLISALFSSVLDFLSPDESGEPKDKETSPLPAKSRSIFDLSLLSHMVGEEKLSLQRASAILGVSVTTLSVAAQQHGIPLARKRPKRHPAKTEREALRRLRKGCPLPEICQDLNLSVVHLNRLLRAHPKISCHRQNSIFRFERRRHRNALQELITRSPAMGRSQIRKAIPSTWVWLYRHDAAWLKSTLPPPLHPTTTFVAMPRADWKHRDAMAAAAVRETARLLLEKDGKPVRLSRSTLARAAGILSIAEKHPELLPETSRCLGLYSETVEDFQIRRVCLCSRNLREKGLPALPWQIRRAAGLGIDISPRVQEIIERVAGVLSPEGLLSPDEAKEKKSGRDPAPKQGR
ncbi:TnsD family Tn7-like transposition protein [Geobacter anodireducens]